MRKFLLFLTSILIFVPVCLHAKERAFSISNISHKTVVSEDVEGIEFKMNVKVYDNRGRRMQVFGFIQYQNENGDWKYLSADPDLSFVNNRGQVYAQSRFVHCGRKKAGRKGIKVFVPLSLFPKDSGTKYYRVRFRVCDRFNNNFEYKDSSEIPYYYFELKR